MKKIYRFIYGTRCSGKNYLFILDLVKVISKTYNVPYSIIVKDLLDFMVN